MRAAGLSICGTLAVLAACSLAAPASAASGLEPGVHLDPGSPAEKQYVLTLNQARQTGSRPSSSKQGSSPAPFGSGITPPPSSGGTSHGTSGSTSSQGNGPTAGGSSSGRAAHATPAPSDATRAPTPTPLPAAVLRASRAQDSSAGSGSLLSLIGGGLAILVVGTFGGTVLRHNRRRPRPSA